MSDSDSIIILDTNDEDEEAMEVEQIQYIQHEQVITSPAENTINNFNVLQNEEPNNYERHYEGLQEVINDIAEIDNREYGNRSRSPSLLSSQGSSSQPPELPLNTNNSNRNESEAPVEKELCSNKKEGSPQKRRHLEDDNEDDGTTCPICLDNWTNLGDHRICALKCGHLFGASCIIRWFLTQQKKSCPTCKKKAVKSDIRYIYAKKLIAMDASELEEIKKQLDNMTEEKNRIQIELTRAVCREHLIMQQVEDLKRRVHDLDTALEMKRKFGQVQSNSDSVNSDTVRLYMDKSLEICKEGGCRVFDYNSSHDLIAVSMKSPNSLFPGFGVRKINVSTYKPTTFLPLHTQSIRDVRFHSVNHWLLSVSLDKTVKVFDTNSNVPISAYSNVDGALWSCCWDSNNPHMFYVGKQQGSVIKFDIRNMIEPICTLEVPGDRSPVVSVASMAVSPGNAVARGGVICCKLNSLWVFENTADEYTSYPLPMEGPFISMMYHNDHRQLLASTRSNSRIPYSRHHLCSIENGTSNNLLCNSIHCFPGSTTQKLLSRSCIASNLTKYYVAAYQEANKSVFLWSISTGHKAFSLPARDSVLDLCGITSNNINFLVSLTEKKLEFFKFV